MVKYIHPEGLEFKIPIEETSADLNYAKYLDNPNSNDEFDESFLRHAAASQKQLGGIQSVTNMNIGIFGLDDDFSMLNALDASTDITTAALLRVHLLRILMTIWHFFHLGFLYWLEYFESLQEIIHQFVYILCCEAKVQSKKLKFSIRTIDYIVEAINYRYFIIERLPLVLCQFLFRNLICYSPSGLKEFQDSFPLVEMLLYPQSTCLLLKINDNLLAPPPDIPQPYLDNEKEVKVPSKREYQHALSLRNEYFTQKRTHLAAEKVRMLSEIGRFVTWNCLLTSIKFVDIYERYGSIWDDNMLRVEEKLETLGASILNELCSFTNTCTKDELNYLRNVIPEITLFDIATGTKYIVHGNITEDFGYELEFPDSLDSSTSDKRVLMVYLSDGRLRKELMLDYTLQVISKKDSNYDSRNLLPPTPDLIIITGKTYEKPLQTYGFACTEEISSKSNSPLIYSREGRFGFNQFSRSIFSYVSNNSTSVMNTKKSESATSTANHPDSDSVATTNKSISRSLEPSQYLRSFFNQVTRLTPFRSIPNKEIALEE